MDVLEAIAARRSIRRFKPDPVPDDLVARVLTAAIQAPSGKNRQPWRFVVVRGEGRAEMVRLMREGIERLKAEGIDVGSAAATTRAMEVAPVTVFVYNPEGKHPWQERTSRDDIWELVDVQSVGAAIENMSLAAVALGLGSLWICDVFVAYEEFGKWLGQDGQLVAALSLGYPDESPGPRPRRALAEVTTWL